MAEKKDTVDLTCSAYDAMRSKWGLIDTLLGGTKAMRAAGTTWLPREEKEEVLAYRNRLERSFLYGGFKDTIKKYGNKPFTKPVTLQGEVPDRLKPIEDNADGTGRNLSRCAEEWFSEALKRGLTHVLIDYPSVPDDLSKRDEDVMALRPVFIHVSPANLLGWRSEAVNGIQRLTHIRIHETATEPDGNYGEISVERIRVYNTDTWEIWQKKGDEKEFVLTNSGNHSFNGVPLVTLYLEETGFMTADPPFEDLAWLNLAHWQSYSEQRNILRFTRFGLLFAKGWNREELDKGVVIGPNRFLGSTNQEADLKYVEYNGAGLEAGQKDLEHLEEQMEVLGLQPMLSRSANVKATGQVINADGKDSAIQTWIRGLEAVIRQCYEYAAQWINIELSEDFKADVFSEFALTEQAASDINALVSARQSGDMSRETFLREIKRRGIISDMVDIDAEIAAIEAEGPSMIDMDGQAE